MKIKKIEKDEKKNLNPKIDAETITKTFLHSKFFSKHPLLLKYWQFLF